MKKFHWVALAIITVVSGQYVWGLGLAVVLGILTVIQDKENNK